MIQNNQFKKDSIIASVYLCERGKSIGYSRWKSWELFYSILDEYLKRLNVRWNYETGELEAFDDCYENEAFFFRACNKALDVMMDAEKKAKSKSELAAGVIMLSGMVFWSAVISQTHGITNKIAWIIGFGLFYIPWWFPALVGLLKNTWFNPDTLPKINS